MMELPRGHEKYGNAIGNTPAAEDHNMFVVCSWNLVEVVLNLKLKLTGT